MDAARTNTLVLKAATADGALARDGAGRDASNVLAFNARFDVT